MVRRPMRVARTRVANHWIEGAPEMTQSPRLSRRVVLIRGALGLAGTGLLAACGQPAPTGRTGPAAQDDGTNRRAREADRRAAASDCNRCTGREARRHSGAQDRVEPDRQARRADRHHRRCAVPQDLQGAPALAELVKAGKLPPVAERVGQDPLVVKPLKEIGKYGGIWRRGFTGPGDKWNGYRAGTGPDHVLFWDYTGNKIVPNIAGLWQFEDGGKVLTLTLRRGMKWSDGHPFTADDFVFWFEDMYSNKELVPSARRVDAHQRPARPVEKVDEMTVKFVFPEPYYLLADMLAGATPLGGQSQYGLNFMGVGSRRPTT